MEKIKILIILLISNYFFSQQKINIREDVQVFLLDSEVSMKKYLDPKTPYLFKVVNNTDEKFLIDPQGFIGETSLYECGTLVIKPAKLIPEGYYYRELEDCQNDFIKLDPHSEIIVPLNILGIKYFYELSNMRRYFLEIKSKHNNYTATLFGCNDML